MVTGVIEKIGNTAFNWLTPEGQWRLLVSVAVMAMVVHILYACGLLAFLGFPGFASAADMDKVRRHQIEQSLDNVHAHLCMEEGDDMDRLLIARARELEREYIEVNNGQPYVVNCQLLLKLKQ